MNTPGPVITRKLSKDGPGSVIPKKLLSKVGPGSVVTRNYTEVSRVWAPKNIMLCSAGRLGLGHQKYYAVNNPSRETRT